MYQYYNPNPRGKRTTDCVVRAICAVTGLSWHEAFHKLIRICDEECEMPSSNYIWEKYLITHGYRKRLLGSDCPDCMTVRSFAMMYPFGIFVVCTGSHVVAVIDGEYYDAWDSGDEVISYCFERRS